MLLDGSQYHRRLLLECSAHGCSRLSSIPPLEMSANGHIFDRRCIESSISRGDGLSPRLVGGSCASVVLLGACWVWPRKGVLDLRSVFVDTTFSSTFSFD